MEGAGATDMDDPEAEAESAETFTEEEDNVLRDFEAAGDAPRVRLFSKDAKETGKSAPGVGPLAAASAEAAIPAAFAPSRAVVIGCTGIERACELVDDVRDNILDPGETAAEELRWLVVLRLFRLSSRARDSVASVRELL